MELPMTLCKLEYNDEENIEGKYKYFFIKCEQHGIEIVAQSHCFTISGTTTTNLPQYVKDELAHFPKFAKLLDHYNDRDQIF